MEQSLKVFQCNIQSLQKNKSELQRILTAADYDVALLSETWTKMELESSKTYRISSYYHLCNSRYDNYGGAAIYLRNNFNYYVVNIPQLSDFTQAVAVRIARLDIVIASVYVSPTITNRDFEEDLEKMVHVLRPFKKVLLGGDLNTHHTSWGNDKNNARGQIFLNTVNNENWIILNDGTKTFVPIELNKKSSAIDMTVCSTAVFSDTTWKVLEYGIGSHHLAVETVINANVGAPIKYIYHQKKINEDLALLGDAEIRGIEDLFTNVKQICKKHRRKEKKVPKFWWSNEVDNAWKEKTEARRTFNRVSNEANLINLKRKIAQFKRAKKVEIMKKLNEFPDEITPFTSSKELWAKVGRLTGRKYHQK